MMAAAEGDFEGPSSDNRVMALLVYDEELPIGQRPQSQ